MSKKPYYPPITSQTAFPEGKAYLPEITSPSVRYVTQEENKRPGIRVIELPEPLDLEGVIERLNKHFTESEEGSKCQNG